MKELGHRRLAPVFISSVGLTHRVFEKGIVAVAVAVLHIIQDEYKGYK